MYIVFYKKKNCENSRRFISILNQAGFKDVAYLHVDRERDGSRIHAEYINKYQITHVPTIIVENNTKHSGTMAFKWLHNKINSSRPTDTRQIRNTNPRTFNKNNNGVNKEKTKIIHGLESGYDEYAVTRKGGEDNYMNGYSDIHSNQIIHTPQEDDYVENMKNTGEFDYNTGNIGTFEENTNKKSSRTSDDEMMRKMEQYNRQRESDDNKLKEMFNPYKE
jgi:hypothetical protein